MATRLFLNEDNRVIDRFHGRCIACKILSAKTFNTGSLYAVLSVAWQIDGSFKIVMKSHNIFFALFDFREDASRILDTGPWNIHGNQIIVERWDISYPISNISFDSCFYWVQIFNLSAEKRTVGNLRQIGNLIGKSVEVEFFTEEECITLEYMRVKVAVDVHKPLQTGFFNVLSDGSEQWIDFKYERLANFCYKCGILDHKSSSCSISDSKLDTADSFGPNLRSSMIRKHKRLMHFGEQIHGIFINPIAVDTPYVSSENSSSDYNSNTGVKSPLIEESPVPIEFPILMVEEKSENISSCSEYVVQNEFANMDKYGLQSNTSHLSKPLQVCGANLKADVILNKRNYSFSQMINDLSGLSTNGLYQSGQKVGLNTNGLGNKEVISNTLQCLISPSSTKRLLPFSLIQNPNKIFCISSTHCMKIQPSIEYDEEISDADVAISQKSVLTRRLITRRRRWKADARGNKSMEFSTNQTVLMDEGAGQPLTVSRLKILARIYCPSIFFLSETKQISIKMEIIRKQLGYDNFSYVPPEGSAGGLLVWWKTGVVTQVIEKSQFGILLLCYDEDSKIDFLIYCLHIPSEAGARRRLWEHLNQLVQTSKIPFCFIGDFNTVRSLEEINIISQSNRFFSKDLSEFFFSNDVIDLPASGSVFTWVKRYRDRPWLYEKLDRAICSSDWLIRFPNSELINESIWGSDHCPIILRLAHSEKPKNTPFRYDERWQSIKDYKSVVDNCWFQEVQGSNQFIVGRKIRNCSISLKQWKKLHNTNSATSLAKLQSQLDNLKGDTSAAANTEAVMTILHSMEVEAEKEEKFWKARSRIQWLQHGDSNSNFFHKSVNLRIIRKKIKSLTMEDQVISTPSDISKCIEDFFKTSFQSKGCFEMDTILDKIPTKFTDVMNQSLLSEVSKQEVWEAVNQLGDRKAPGPDGFPGVFFKKHWDVIGDSIFKAFSDFFHGQFLLKAFNQTFLTLLPKIQTPTHPTHFRPISLCNFVYKIFSKCLVNRLKPFMKEIISESQSAFVEGRAISDSIIMAQELFHGLKMKISGDPISVLKLDLQKAYDSLEWDFLINLLRKMGLNETWLSLVFQCISSVSFKILINGEPSDAFTPSKGIRQGDPISPFLFLFAQEALTSVLNFGCANNLFEGYCIKPWTSGLSINPTKSSIGFSSNASQNDKDVIFSKFPYSSLHNDMSYLGIPLFRGRSKSAVFGYILDKITRKLSGWKHKNLSFGGREVLIKVVLQLIPQYLFSCVILPKNVCNKIEAIIRAFWWSGEVKSSKVCWTKWEYMKVSKLKGGMGFLDIYAHNIALVSKLGWKLLYSPNSLWARLMKSVYYQNANFFESCRGSSPSWIWASIFQSKDFLSAKCLRKLGDGLNTRFWIDPWVNGSPNLKLNLLFDPAWCNVPVAEFILPSGLWNVDKLKDTLQNNIRLIDLIQDIPIDISAQDSWIWKDTYNQKFKTSSAYDNVIEVLDKPSSLQFLPSSSIAIPSDFWKVFWKLNLPRRILIFWWRVWSKAIPTAENLVRHKILSSPWCSVCGDDLETAEHVLFQCGKAQAVWSAIIHKYDYSLQCFNSVKEFLIQCVSYSDQVKVQVALITGWKLWFVRNQTLFEKVEMTVDNIVYSIIAMVDHLSISSALVTHKTEVIIEASKFLVSKLTRDIKCFICDASVSRNAAAGAVIAVNSNVSCEDGWVFKFVESDPLRAELSVLLRACLFASKGDIFITDCLNAVELLNADLSSPNQCDISLAIKAKAQDMNWTFMFLPRRFTAIADFYARSCIKNQIKCGWISKLDCSLFAPFSSLWGFG